MCLDRVGILGVGKAGWRVIKDGASRTIIKHRHKALTLSDRYFPSLTNQDTKLIIVISRPTSCKQFGHKTNSFSYLTLPSSLSMERPFNYELFA
jgi:hypothetical protein